MMSFNFLAALFFVGFVLLGLGLLFIVICVTNDIADSFGVGWGFIFLISALTIPFAILIGFTTP